MKVDYDVAVVGSGPAGAACALGLSRLGVTAALIDERAFPRTKVCGEYVNCGAVRELRDLGLGDAIEPHAATLRGMRLAAHDERAEFPFAHDAWAIPRRVLDNTIRSAAIAAGADAVHGRFRGLSYDEGSVRVTLARDGEAIRELRLRFVIGADGMRSSVARACGLTAPLRDERYATGGHYRGVALDRWIEMYASRHGYLALNPLDGDSANVMFVVRRAQLLQSRGALAAELARFASEMTAGARRIDDSMLREERRTIGPLDHRTRKAVAPRVLLVGDAAAFVDPFSGQGVYLALSGARAAVATIERAIGHRNQESVAWDEYAKTIRSSVAERHRVTMMLKAMLGVRSATRRAARCLRARPHVFEPLIAAVSGSAVAPSSAKLALALARALR